MEYLHRCVMCGKQDTMKDPPMPGSNYLCRRCYKKVKREFKKRNPGQSLRLKKPIVN